MKKLKDTERLVNNLLKTIRHLGNRLDVILFQLPHDWKSDKERFKKLLCELSSDYKAAFEFHDQSWWNTNTYELLNKHNAAFSIYIMLDEETPREITSDTICLRLHRTKKK